MLSLNLPNDGSVERITELKLSVRATFEGGTGVVISEPKVQESGKDNVSFESTPEL